MFFWKKNSKKDNKSDNTNGNKNGANGCTKQKESNHSEAFEVLLKTMNSKGMDRAYSDYDPNMFDKIYEWERDEAEDIIWNGFNNDIRLSVYFSKLTKYDGIEALIKKMSEAKVPSPAGANLARELYTATGEEKYIDVIKQHLDAALELSGDSNASRDGNASNEGNASRDGRSYYESASFYLTAMVFCKPCEYLYSIFEDVYLNNPNEENRNIAAVGLMIGKGVLDEYRNLHMQKEVFEIWKKFDADTREERERILESFNSGEMK